MSKHRKAKARVTEFTGGARRTKPAQSKATRRAASYVPQKLSGKGVEVESPEDGPAGWFLPQMEATYMQLQPRGAPVPRAPAARQRSRSSRQPAFASAFRPGAGEAVLNVAPSTVWIDRLAEYKRRKAAAHLRRVAPGAPVPGAPAIPGAVNWVPLGPLVVLHGQTIGEESVGGRVVGLAIAPGGQRIYAASACGGVFRSDDAGTTWRSVMEGFDVDPTNFASSSLACGAIAIDSGDPERIYVGTGEGETHAIFSRRVVSALPAYRGIGPIKSDDGGTTWVTERTAAGSTSLAGEAFFALAVDPRQRENVVAATTGGLYQRSVRADGTGEWTARRAGVHSSVVVAASSAITRFFAAEWGGRVWTSADGQTWSSVGTGFGADAGRITLAVRSTDPSIVYALVSRRGSGLLLGIHRLDVASGQWSKIANPPDVLPEFQGRSQGDYDLAIAIDPNASNRLYLGGSYADVDPFPASVWRVEVEQTGSTWQCANATSIGTHAHSDVHVLAFSPGDSHELWCGCDGGIFLNRDPSGTGEFASQNNGLSCLCSNFVAQHPTDPGVLFTGLQDNGTARTSGGSIWSHVNYGDGGYCLINWNNPSRVLSFVNGTFYRSTTGGMDHDSWSPVWRFGWATMTQPVVGAPFNPAAPNEANTIAVGAGALVFVSDDFGTSWPQNGRLQLPGGSPAGSVFALAFASVNRLFIGTTTGQVFRADRVAGGWTLTRIDNALAGPLGLQGLITDVAVDWSDAGLGSVFVCFGGLGDRRRVWRFDGSRWEARSGPAGGDNLLDVEHNALAIDRVSPANIYVGADIGVWLSSDHGATWRPIENGLPDAPVYDLQIHETRRILRAATYGRGVYEIALD
ncbi:MAG TPA: hypothetical protein VHI99_21020 [Vicinamibacterales bacterium]|nr:hypothetical protein [Vicinamibacterales bacterium]